MRKINKDILFLSGIIMLCFGFLLFHINPFSVGPYETVEGRFTLFFWSLLRRPFGTVSIFSGLVMIWRGLTK